MDFLGIARAAGAKKHVGGGLVRAEVVVPVTFEGLVADEGEGPGEFGLMIFGVEARSNEALAEVVHAGDGLAFGFGFAEGRSEKGGEDGDDRDDDEEFDEGEGSPVHGPMLREKSMLRKPPVCGIKTRE